MGLATVVLMFFAIMEARELKRRHRQWPYLAAAVLLTLLLLSRIYLGLEWFSGAMLGAMLGLAWASVVGIAYRQRARRRFSGSMASLVFYGTITIVLAWQTQVNTPTELDRISFARSHETLSAEEWWQGRWRDLPADRTGVTSVASRKFNAQFAVGPGDIAERMEASGWRRVPPSDWRWILRALNPDPDEASLPLLGRAYQGRGEALLLRSPSSRPGNLLTLRMWDSGFRLSPGGQVLYLAQVMEEELVQRFGLFSYWRATQPRAEDVAAVQALLGEFELKHVAAGYWLMAAGPNAQGSPR
jgi:hypothetical protein